MTTAAALRAYAAQEASKAGARIVELERENTRLRSALDDVVHPLAALQKQIEAGGGRMNSNAPAIANSLTFVQDIARRALAGEKTDDTR